MADTPKKKRTSSKKKQAHIPMGMPTNVIAEVDTNIRGPVPQDIVPIEDLLSDQDKLEQIDLLLSLGQSIGSVASQIGIATSTLRRWIDIGQKHRAEYIFTQLGSPYMLLYDTVVSAIGKARGLAEANAMDKRPDWWLEKGPGKLIDEEWSIQEQEEEATNVDLTDPYAANKLAGGQEVLDALEVLLNQGYDLNNVVRDRMLTVNAEKVVETEVSNAESIGKLESKPLRPKIMQLADDVERILNLKYGEKIVDAKEDPN